MVTELDGQWPWEKGEMPVVTPRPLEVEPSTDLQMYTLPKRKARRGEDADDNGLRPLSAKERAVQIAGEDDKDYFKWR